MGPPLGVGGIGSGVSFEDVARVARGDGVVLDTAACERLKKDSPPKGAKLDGVGEGAAPAQPETAGSWLITPQARAALLARLLPLANGRSKLRLGVFEQLVRLLQPGAQLDQLLPAASDPVALRQLAITLPERAIAAGDGGLSAAEQAVVDGGGLSADERAALAVGQPVAAGVAAVAISDAQQLLTAVAAVTALTAEALQADVTAFEPEAQSAAPVKSVVAAADQLMALLAGSKQINPRKGRAVGSISAAPQVLGEAVDALATATPLVKAELAAAAPPPARLAALPPPTRQLGRRLADAAAALQQVAAGSRARLGELSQAGAQVSAPAVAEQPSPAAVPSAAEAALQLWQLVEALPGLLAAEALAAATVLRQQEAAAAQPAADGAAVPKRKGKGPSGPVLGKGTAVVRSIVDAAAAGAAEYAAAADIADRMAALSLPAPGDTAQPAANGSAGGGGYAEALQRVAAALDPAQPQLARNLATLRAVLEANQVQRKPKIPKGTRDLLPDQMAIREMAFRTITGVFQRHGAVAIDTPVFELRETLMGKYGEDSKLIYDLADQGGEILSLRYDLTVPFARYIALNGITNIKRYHIAKVYRRDQPQMNRGRFREFYQCDLDIAGAYPLMVPDAEILKVTVEVLQGLQLAPADAPYGGFIVKLNHRRLLDAMLAVAGVPTQKFRAICSAIDKLDKADWAEVRQEMTEDKGLPGAVADRIHDMIALCDVRAADGSYQRQDPAELLQRLQAAGSPLADHPDSKAALEEMSVLFGFLGAMGVLPHISFDLSLARGLDYYTGIIYEAILTDPSTGVGSIAAGGRYDKLVGMFSGKDVPAVGISIGIERVFSVLEARKRQEAQAANGFIRSTYTQVLVASIGSGMQPKRMEIAARLWESGIAAEFGFKPNPKMAETLKTAFDGGIPFIVLFGSSELEAGVVKVKDLAANTQDDVPLTELAAELKRRITARGEFSLIAAGAAAQPAAGAPADKQAAAA